MKNDGLVLDGLKMSSIQKVTEKKISALTMVELDVVFSRIPEQTKKDIVTAIHERNHEKLGVLMLMAIYQVKQFDTCKEYDND